MKSVDIKDDPYSLHLIGDCDVDCEFCKEEEQKELRKQSRKNENKEPKRS